MTFPDFEKLTPAEQLDVLDNANMKECQFWMERLKTALDNKAPHCVTLLSKALIPEGVSDIYWNLIKLKN